MYVAVITNTQKSTNLKKKTSKKKGAISDIYDTHHYTDSLADAVKVALEASCDMNSCLGNGCGGMASDYATGG